MAVPLWTSSTKHLYPTDLLSMLLALLFAVGSFLNIGSGTVRVLGILIDRELLSGLEFLLLLLLLPLMFRLLNPIHHRAVQFFRLFYPQLLYLLYYQNAIRLSHYFFGGRSFDAVFAHADKAIFSFQPSIRFHELFSGIAPVNELFFFGYFSFFGLMTVGWWVLYAKRRDAEAVSTLTIVTFAFYTLYLFYALFPVEGPKYYFPSLHKEWYSNFNGYFFTALMKQLFDHVDLAGAAFPSSHVAISTLALSLNLRHLPRLAAVFLPITVVLIFSTVYIYAHYAVDVFAGLLVAALFRWAVPRALELLDPAFEACDSAIAHTLHLDPIAALGSPARP